MATLRIYDLDEQGVLAVTLARLLDLLGPRALLAEWTVLPVAEREPGHDGFEATGPDGEQLETLAARNAVISGADLASLAGGVSPKSANERAALPRGTAPTPVADSPTLAQGAAPATGPSRRATSDALDGSPTARTTNEPADGPPSRRATNEPQIVWGQFVALLPGESDPWLTLRAIDSTFYEIKTEDEAVLSKLRTSFSDVR